MLFFDCLYYNDSILYVWKVMKALWLHFLLSLLCPPAPPPSGTPSWGRGSGSLQTHWRKQAERIVKHSFKKAPSQLAKGPVGGRHPSGHVTRAKESDTVCVCVLCLTLKSAGAPLKSRGPAWPALMWFCGWGPWWAASAALMKQEAINSGGIMTKHAPLVIENQTWLYSAFLIMQMTCNRPNSRHFHSPSGMLCCLVSLYVFPCTL